VLQIVRQLRRSMEEPQTHPVIAVVPEDLQSGLAFASVLELDSFVFHLFQERQIGADRVFIRRCGGAAGTRHDAPDYHGYNSRSFSRHIMTTPSRSWLGNQSEVELQRPLHNTMPEVIGHDAGRRYVGRLRADRRIVELQRRVVACSPAAGEPPTEDD